MKVALVALPQPEDIPAAPPLPLAYAAAMLEQQRHIVRIYDLALCDAVSLVEALAPLRTFRPHIVAIAATDQRATLAAKAALQGCGATVLHLGATLRAFVPDQTIASVFWRLVEQPVAEDDQNLIFSTLLGLDDELDALPFPARHLLPLERYSLAAPTGELQTTVLAGQLASSGEIIPRTPGLVVAELHSIAREHGIHHVLFLDPPLTHDLAWLREMFYDLTAADLGIGWEGAVRHQRLSPELLDLAWRAGCEALCFQFRAAEVLDSRDERATLLGLVAHAHELGIWVRAQIELEPPYGAIPALVDMSATFGLDDVRFSVKQSTAAQPAEAERPEPADLAEMAHLRYRSRRRRQLFIQRFGPQLGPMLWRAGLAGLLGRAWQYYADGAADRALRERLEMRD